MNLELKYKIQITIINVYFLLIANAHLKLLKPI